MNILYLASIHVPAKNASGIQITSTCNSFAKNADSVEIVLLTYVKNLKSINRYYQLQNVAIRRVLPLSISFIPGRLFVRMEVLLALFFAKYYAMTKKPSYIYTREPLVALFFINFFLEVHVIPEKLTFINKLAYKRAKKIICISNGLKNALIKMGIAEQKICVSPDAVDLNKYNHLISKNESRERLGIHTEKKVIVYTGSLFEDRGAKTIIDFLIQLPESYVFYIVGDVQAELLAVLKRIERVVCVGRKPHEEIPVWQRAADALVLFNSAKVRMYNDFTSPMKLFEYMASGNPILAPDLPSIREILSERSAVLVSPDDSRAYQSGLERMFSNPGFSKEISEEAFRHVTNFTWDKRARDIITFLKA